MALMLPYAHKYKQNKKINSYCKFKFKGSDIVIEFDEYKIELENMKKDITDLRDSL